MDDIEVCIMMFMIIICYIVIQRSNRTPRRWWVREANLTREIDGYFKTCYQRIKNNDPEQFFKHTRMTRPVYDLLLNLLTEGLAKKSIRSPIDPECRLAVTLSYLSQGVSHQFLAWSYKMGKSTVREIILETCDVLWNILSPIYVSQLIHQDYNDIMKDFQNIWDMSNCIGALDGKHIHIRCPRESGSNFYNYKNSFSIVLLAACDAHYCFTAIDVGAYGSQSDGGVLQHSEFGKLLLREELPLPADSILPNSETISPPFFVADPAFPLKTNIMRPYSGKLLEKRKRVFNYRLSRARVVIENAFGILVARWRVLQTNMHCIPENAEKIVLATVALHNFIMLNKLSTAYNPPCFTDWEDAEGNLQPGEWRKEVTQTFETITIGSNNATRKAFELRDTLMEYFMKEGAIERQNKIK